MPYFLPTFFLLKPWIVHGKPYQSPTCTNFLITLGTIEISPAFFYAFFPYFYSMRPLYCFLICLCCILLHAQPKPGTDTLLQNILQKNKDSLFQQVLTHPNTYRLQIVYTQINRDKNNKPHFTNYYFNADTNLYYYPASTVKLPLAALSLEKLNELNKEGVNKYTAMQFDSAYPRQVREYNDSTSQTGLPSIAQFLRKAFLISDNDAYNRMYQFVGQQAVNRKRHGRVTRIPTLHGSLWDLPMKKTGIRTRYGL